MNDDMFKELLESVKQAGDIRKGKSKVSSLSLCHLRLFQAAYLQIR